MEDTTMTFNGPRVMAAPNQCEIQAKVLRSERSARFPDKMLLDLQILKSRPIVGPNFAHVGHKVKAFTLDSISSPLEGLTIKARAEFLGDEHGGVFRLTQIEIVR
jgi:hypothetical protein